MAQGLGDKLTVRALRASKNGKTGEGDEQAPANVGAERVLKSSFLCVKVPLLSDAISETGDFNKRH